MLVSFIIPLYNCLQLTQTMLASLQQTLPIGFKSEIIFVDDGSSDGTRDWLSALPPNCRSILNEKNLGFATTCNRGAASAKGEFLFFLNNDLILLPNWLDPMLLAFRKFPSIGMVGNVQLNAATGTIDHAGVIFNHKGKPQHVASRPWSSRISGYREVAALTGACFAIRRTFWEKLGGFDEGFINGAEDVDLCLRASANGAHHYVALRSIVRHHISASLGRKIKDEQNTHRLFQRWKETIIGLSARDWSRNYLKTHWDQSFVYDYGLLQEVLFYWLGLMAKPSPRVIAGTRKAVELELERWTKLFQSSA